MSTNNVYMDEHGAVMGEVSGSRMAEAKASEADRAKGIRENRMWYDGTQYDAQNEAKAKLLQVADATCLPEHEKLHAYSTQISESVDFIAAQMTEGFRMEAKDPKVDAILKKALHESPGFRGGLGTDDVSLTNSLRDALVAMDSPVLLRWDAVKETVWFDEYDSEKVWFVYEEDDPDVLERVIYRRAKWTLDPGNMEETKRVQSIEWFLSGGVCWEGKRWDGEQEWDSVYSLEVPFIPWVPLRAKRKRRAQTRGQSIISGQARAAASRYNAVEQVSFLVARYNSHGNLAVIGDGATLKAQMEDRISKDVADILTFPGGTALQVITLPTDPAMVEHQRNVLLDTLYGCFGLARQDGDAVTGKSNVSGYALEILNRKTEATFKEIKNQFIGDMRSMLMMALDYTAYRTAIEEYADVDPTAEEHGDEMAAPMQPDELDLAPYYDLALPATELHGIVPEDVFPNRDIDIDLGSGFIVDQALIRADFVAGLISRAESLRLKGYSDPEIKLIMGEIEDEQPQEPEVALSKDALEAAAQAKTKGLQSGKTADARGAESGE